MTILLLQYGPAVLRANLLNFIKRWPATGGTDRRSRKAGARGKPHASGDSTTLSCLRTNLGQVLAKRVSEPPFFQLTAPAWSRSAFPIKKKA